MISAALENAIPSLYITVAACLWLGVVFQDEDPERVAFCAEQIAMFSVQEVGMRILFVSESVCE